MGWKMNREIEGVYALWKREIIRFYRSKSRVIGSLGMPFFFLAIIGTGLNNVFPVGDGVNYLQFMAPGIVGMVLMFGSMFSGITVIMDRQFGFLRETLVAPISRLSIVAGKCLGGATTAVIQALIMLGIAMLLGAQLHVGNLLMLLGFMFLISLMFVAFGVAIASRLQDMHGFQMIMNFLIMPMFFLSGALFPLTSAPDVLKAVSMIDPLTYGVNGLRFLMVGVSDINLAVSFVVTAAFTTLFMIAAAYLFNKIEE